MRKGSKMSLESREKMSRAKKEYFKTHKVWNEGSKGIVKAWNKGLHIRCGNGGFKKGHKINLGKKFSDEWRDNISKSHKGQHSSPQTEFKKDQNSKEKNINWKGGRYKQVKGYILILKPEHPFADKQGYVFEHRLVMEKYLGRYLHCKERIHHINEIKDDNRIENFILFKDGNKHCWFHRKNGEYHKGIVFDGRKCHSTNPA